MVNKGKVISLPCHAIIHVVHPQRPLLRSRHTDKDEPPATTTSSGTALVYPEWPSFQAYSAIPPHAFFPPTVPANPQAHPYMWGPQMLPISETLPPGPPLFSPIVPPYGTPPPPPYVMYPPGTVYAHPSTPPAMHPFGHYSVPTNGHAETHGAAPSALEMNGASFSSESEGSDENSQNDSHSKDNDGKEDGDSQNGMSYSASQGVVNQTMAMLPMQPGAMVGGVPSSTTANLNIGVDYWAAPGSALSPQRTAKRQLVQLEETNGKIHPTHHRLCLYHVQIVQDERELKKQKRKQPNRESARRSRLRKKVLCNPRVEC
ncbi:Transcription factor HBP-1a [Zea mays]|uniref:Transcription factor HBP-1a n=1 Tax=Zea mays TaxID=4577 RepID=A0A3L6DS32_MAIZE|nr:Transcription factor HBP-1a [Zea mays]